MKDNVWVIEWFTAVQYEEDSGVHSVYSTEELALEYYNTHRGVQEANDKPFEEDYFLHEPTAYEVQNEGQ